MITEKHIKESAKITFTHPKYGGRVYAGYISRTHIVIENGLNCEPFKAFCNHKGYEPNHFVEKIVGYEASGSWPEVKSKEDIAKVLNAMISAAPDLVITIGEKTFLASGFESIKITLDDFFKVK